MPGYGTDFSSAVGSGAQSPGLTVAQQTLTTLQELKTQGQTNDTAMMQMIVEAYELTGTPQDYKEVVSNDVQS